LRDDRPMKSHAKQPSNLPRQIRHARKGNLRLADFVARRFQPVRAGIPALRAAKITIASAKLLRMGIAYAIASPNCGRNVRIRTARAGSPWYVSAPDCRFRILAGQLYDPARKERNVSEQ